MTSTVSSPRRLPSDPPQPDLSHLTEEERQIIESVLERQKVEAERDQHLISNLEQDVKRLEANIKKQIELSTDSPSAMTSPTDGDTCRICNKVKFAGGAGYTCHYCRLKSCSRCGGKLTLKAKAIWACNLCRKKQELALKTGQWYHGMKPAGMERRGSLVKQTSLSSDTESSCNRRSRDMRIGGAAKRSSSAHALMETDQMDENGNHSRMNLRKSNGDVSRQGRLRGEMETTPFIIPKSKPSVAVNRQRSVEDRSPSNNSFSGSSASFTRSKEDSASSQAQMLPNQTAARANKYTSVDVHESRVQQQRSPSGSLSADMNRATHRLTPTSLDKVLPGSSDTSSTIRERTSSTSSRRSDGSRRSTAGRIHPVNEAELHRDSHMPISSRSPPSRQDGSPECLSDVAHSQAARHGHRPNPPPRRNVPEPAVRQLKPDHGVEPRRGSGREIVMAADDVAARHRSPPVTGYANRDLHNKLQHSPGQHRRNSNSSIDKKVSNIDKRHDAKLQDTRENNSSQESNSTNTSNQLAVPGMMSHSEQLQGEGDNVKTARSRRREMAMLHADSLSSDPSDCVRPPPPKPHKHRKVKNNDTNKQHISMTVKTGDFSSSEDEMRSTTSCGDDLESESVMSEKAPSTSSSRYEGVSSTAINAKIKNFLAHPVEWHVSANGRYIEGHMMLSRYLTVDGKKTDGAVLGLRVVGGKMNKDGRLGAFITNVKPGSIADVIGHLQRDDEVIEWNGRSLRDVTNDEASDIITEARHEPLVELIVQRPYSKDNLPPQMMSRDESRELRERRWNDSPPSVTVTAPDSPSITRKLMSITHVSGKIQLKVSYDSAEEELIILVLSASELPLVDGNQPPQPYCQVCLLPDNNESIKRRTRPVSRTREPEWKQSFSYRPISNIDFEERSIEVTVWDLKKNGQSEFLGEIVIDLPSTKLSAEPLWYRLRHHDASASPLSSHKQVNNRNMGSDGHGRGDTTRFNTGSGSRRNITERGMEDLDDVNMGHHMDGGNKRRQPLHQMQPRGRHDNRQSPRSLHSSREDVGGHSPIPSRRRHLPNLPPSPGRGQRGSDVHYSQQAAPHYNDRHMEREGMYTHSDDNTRYRDGNRSRSSDRYYSDNRVSPDEDMLMSDASEISSFSMQSTQSERPSRSNNNNKRLSEFTTQMENRGAGRRAGPPHGMPSSHMASRDQHEGSMSDSGIALERKGNRMKMGSREYGGSNHHMNDGYDRHRMGRPDPHMFNDRRPHRLHKQASKDSTDGSICSVSSDSSNAKQVFAHISSRIEGLKRASNAFSQLSMHDNNLNRNNHVYGDMPEGRRASDASLLSDVPYASDVASLTDIQHGNNGLSDYRRDSDTSLRFNRRSSCTSLASSLYEDDLARAQNQMSEIDFLSPRNRQYERQHDMSNNIVLDPTTIGERLNEIGAQRRADPRRGLPVNEIVAAISNPAFRAQNASASSVVAPSTAHNSHYQDSGYQSSASNHSSTGQLPPHQRAAQFPYGRRPDVAHLNGSARLAFGPHAMGDPALPWAQPRNGSDGLNDFINDLGKGQIVGRQVLGTSCIGWIQMGLSDKKGRLEVELIRAKDLHIKSGAKNPPSTYAKVYLMDGKTCVEKMKTPHSERNTTEPFFKCILTFMEPYMQKMLHVMVWGDYGRLNERKVFMGVCQVSLDELDLSNIVFGWYKLFNMQAMAGPGSYRRQSQTSADGSSPRYGK